MNTGIKNYNHIAFLKILEGSGMSAKEIAEKSGFALSTVYSWIQGKKTPTEYSLEILAKLWGCSVNDFCFSEEELIEMRRLKEDLAAQKLAELDRIIEQNEEKERAFIESEISILSSILKEYGYSIIWADQSKYVFDLVNIESGEKHIMNSEIIGNMLEGLADSARALVRLFLTMNLEIEEN